MVVFVVGCARKIRPANSQEDNKKIVMNMFVNGFVVMIIANVPEGLPTTITMTLTIIAKKMAKRKVFIKKLECVEALGSASCIASDKTGTLTLNKMSVEHVWFDGHIYTSNFIKESRKDFKGNPTWKTLFKVGCLCNKAIFKEPDEDKEKRRNEKKEQELGGQSPDKLVDNNDGVVIKKKSDKPLMDQKKAAEEMKKFRQSSKNLVQDFKKASGSFRADVEIIGDTTKNMANSQILLAQIKDVNMEEDRKMMMERDKRKGWQVIGDASESALVRFCDDFKNTDLFKTKYEKIFEVPFNSKNKYQLSVHEIYEKRFLVMKGAPEMIIKRCSHYMKHGQAVPMDDDFINKFQKTYEVLGAKGERVLGCAFFDLGNDKTKYSISLKNYKDEGLMFVGLFALMDPPKAGVEEAITAARAAFIRVMMVTGDHPLTAEAIARKVGIIRNCQTAKEVAAKKKIPIEAVDANDALAKV
jgi:magnesium-transporting ATPase (P-type)